MKPHPPRKGRPRSLTIPNKLKKWLTVKKMTSVHTAGARARLRLQLRIKTVKRDPPVVPPTLPEAHHSPPRPSIRPLSPQPGGGDTKVLISLKVTDSCRGSRFLPTLARPQRRHLRTF